MDFIKALGILAKIDFLPLQPGDAPKTYSNIDDLINDIGFKTRDFDRRRNREVY